MYREPSLFVEALAMNPMTLLKTIHYTNYLERLNFDEFCSRLGHFCEGGDRDSAILFFIAVKAYWFKTSLTATHYNPFVPLNMHTQLVNILHKHISKQSICLRRKHFVLLEVIN